MNGDGKPDYVNYHKDDKYWKVYFNKGTRFSTSKNKWNTSNSVKFIQDVREEKGKATNTRSTFMDFNRDGYLDIVRADGDDDRELRYALNTGSDFQGLKTLTMPTKAWIREAERVRYNSKGGPTHDLGTDAFFQETVKTRIWPVFRSRRIIHHIGIDSYGPILACFLSLSIASATSPTSSDNTASS